MNGQFQTFLENIKLTAAQRDDAKAKYDGVCEKLHSVYYPNSKYDGSTKLLIGSYGKRTHIRPARDIDIIFIMPQEKFQQYDDNSSNKQSQLLNDIKYILEEKYPDTPIKAFGKVVVLEFAEGSHSVDLLPAWESNEGTFIIPNSERGGFWEQWDPRQEIKDIDESDKSTGKTRSLIRMVKKWSENCTVKIKSFEIEKAVLAFFVSGHSAEDEYSALLKNFFDCFHAITTDADVKSHLATALNRATKALEFEKDDDLESAVDEWQKIFGDDFPTTIEKAVMVKGAIPALADYSHCEPLKWPLIEAAKVRVDASIYDASGKKKFGGINSDGRNLRAGFQIRYQARTTLAGLFKYHWQVVNTGSVAESEGGLRGNIFEGGQTRWESTRYPGKHWIECFLVRNEICVARSGKFLINIK